MIRLIHTADWQLGKPYGRFNSDVRGALTEVRFDAIDALGRAAAGNNAAHVLVAGDVFDTDGPEDGVIVQTSARDTHDAAQLAATEAATRLAALEQNFSDLEAVRAK